MKTKLILKRIAVAAIGIILMVSCIALGACSCNGGGETSVLQSISVTKAPTKTEYLAGEIFDPSGMEITAVYDDGSSETVSGWSVVGGENPLKESDTSVRIMYTEGDTSRFAQQSITVSADSSYFHASQAVRVPAERPVSASNVDQYYSVGSDRNVVDYIGAMDLGCAVTFNVTSLTAQDATMTVCAAGQEDGDRRFNTMFDIFVNGEMLSVSNDVIVKNEDKIKYFLFRAVDFDIELQEGKNVIVVRSHQEEGLDCKATNFAYIRLLPKDEANKGSISRTQLAPEADDVLQKLEIIRQPAVTEYLAGAVFNPAEMIARATFEGGFEYDVPLAELVYPTSGLAVGTTKVTVSYSFGGATETADVAVTVSEKAMESLTVTGDFKKSYYEFEYFDKTNMVVTLGYNDGSSDILGEEKYAVTTTRLSEGTTSVTVTHTDSPLTAEVPVTVKPYGGQTVEFGAKEATGETNTENPDVSSPAFDFADAHGFCGGMNLGKTVTYRVTSSEAQTVGAAVYVAGHETGNKRFNQLFTVKVGDNPVTVGDDVIVENPNNIAYFYIVRVNIAIELAAGENTVTFTGIAGQGTNFSGIALTPESIDKTVRGPKTAPDEDATLVSIALSGNYKTEYFSGDKFNPSGLIVTASYSDGFTQAVTDYSVSSSALDSSTTSVAVSYEYKGVTKSANAAVTVSDVTISGAPVRFNAVDASTNGNLEPNTSSSNPEVTVNGNVGGLNDPASEAKFVEFNVTSSSAQYAVLTVAVAGNAGGNMPFDSLYNTYVNDDKISVSDTVAWHGTEYTYFVTVSVSIKIKEGANTVRFTNNGSAATNFAWIELTLADADATVSWTSVT